MRSTRVRAAAAATTLLAAALLTGCTADADGGSEPTDAAEPSATATTDDDGTAEEPAPTGPTEVPDVTLLILETAQGNLLRAGFEVETVDAAGAPVAVDDATTYKVVAQDPAEGTLEPGATVTLTVEPRG